MKCPYCENLESKVIDSRPTECSEKIRRRRECTKCFNRFTTYEMIETTPVVVIKSDGSNQAFNRDKLFIGLLKSCEKRPISSSKIEKIVYNIEMKLQSSLNKEIRSSVIGEYAMDYLKEIDEIAYVRFASVYKRFKDIDTFMKELKKLLDERKSNL